MSKLLSILLAAGLLLYPFATYAADYGSQPSQNQQVPPVAQTLVREGDFAIKLAPELGLGSSSEETEAIDILTRAGVMPLNGWIPDYPMTPEIIGQLSDSIMHAAQQGKLPVSSDSAEKKLADIAVEMNLPLPGYGAAGYRSGPTTDYNRTVVNDYYFNEGPPVITYYPPPPDYLYLYDWVPFPVVWFGFGFPGFFICHNFTTVVSFTAFPHRHHFRTLIVTNHIIDPVTRRSAHIQHVFRSRQGVIRPETVLLTSGGSTFRNVMEFRHGLTAGTGSFGQSGRFSRAVPRTAQKMPQAAPSLSKRPSVTSRMQQNAFNAPLNLTRPKVTPRMPRRFSNPPSMTRPAPNTAQRSLRPPLQMRMIPPSQQHAAPPSFARSLVSPRMPQRSMTAPPSTAPNMNGRQFAAPSASSRQTPSFSGGASSGRAAGGFHGHSGGRHR